MIARIQTHCRNANAARSALASPPKLAAFANAPLVPAAEPPVAEDPLLEAVPEAGRRVPAGAEPAADAPVALAPEAAEELAGATAAIAATLAHCAAEFAELSPCLYGMKETAPVLSSWTSAVMDAAYCAFGSLVVGPASVDVELFSTLMT